MQLLREPALALPFFTVRRAARAARQRTHVDLALPGDVRPSHGPLRRNRGVPGRLPERIDQAVGTALR
jgi:hypothetical protein